MNNVLPITAKANKKNHLEIGGVDTVNLAKKFGTPLYVLDEKTIKSACRSYFNAFKKYPNFFPIFASKSLCAKSVLKIISDEGFGVDVSTAGELYTAIKAKVPKKNIYFHGNNKLEEEIIFALKENIGCFIADNFDEILSLEKLSKKMNKKPSVMIRINPGIEAHTHDFIKTGIIDSKFGFQKSEIENVVRFIKNSDNLNFAGLHSHIGSQIFDIDPFVAEVEVLFDTIIEIKSKFNLECRELNIGGGIGVAYSHFDTSPNINEFAQKVSDKIVELSTKHNLSLPKLIIEPGRSIVARAGITLYTVGTVKRIPNIRNYVIVDGGMTDNPRYILYQAKYEAFSANKINEKPQEIVTIAGRACESGDVVIKDIKMPILEKGDIIAVASTGAYNYSMASNYNRMQRPAMVLVNNKKARLIIKRETKEDLLRNDL